MRFEIIVKTSICYWQGKKLTTVYSEPFKGIIITDPTLKAPEIHLTDNINLIFDTPVETSIGRDEQDESLFYLEISPKQ